jgi:amino acid adenylation domain-containing protein
MMNGTMSGPVIPAAGSASIARNGVTPFPVSTSLPQAFAHVVAARPDHIALIAGDGSLRYAELDALSDALAARIAGSGVARGACVGIHMERSAEAIVAMLAILKAGATYVPFDPAAPAARLRAQAQAAAIGVLLVATATSPAWFDGTIITVDTTVPTPRPAVRTPLDLHPLELAYVIHTSGSTNEAKGVCATHRGVIDLIVGAAYCGFSPDDVVYHGMSIAFDGSTFEIWGALLNGARLVIAPPHVAIHDICTLAERHRISVLLLSTGVFNAFDRDSLRRLGSVRVLLAGGDVMSPPTASTYLADGGRVVVNGYGPTEITTFSHCHVMTAANPPAGVVPIGVPVNGTAAYVLDANLWPQPIGVEGELSIAGTGLARGYLGNPALTAERFLPDPFAADGSRMYRTGDLVVQGLDGRLDYVGRIDTQVKIRGFRVELAEIEHCLRRCGPLVDACVVHVRSAADASQLHAYGVREAGTVDAITLDARLREQLPEYMLPRRLVFLDALPLTLNGKVDRRALEALARDAPHDTAAIDATLTTPTDALERQLLTTLRHLLRRPSLQLSDNFFDVGGDSLVAMSFCAAIGADHGVELPLNALFDGDTLSEIVAQVRVLKQRHASAVHGEVPA